MRFLGVSMFIVFAVCVSASVAGAGDENVKLIREIDAAEKKWADALATANPDVIVALYDKQAVLWPTLSAKRRETPEQLRAYFVVLAAKKNLKVDFRDQGSLIRIYGNGAIAINTGDYVFSFQERGKTVSLPSRYSFVYVKTPEGWKIIDHHSSVMPADTP